MTQVNVLMLLRTNLEDRRSAPPKFKTLLGGGGAAGASEMEVLQEQVQYVILPMIFHQSSFVDISHFLCLLLGCAREIRFCKLLGILPLK